MVQYEKWVSIFCTMLLSLINLMYTYSNKFHQHLDLVRSCIYWCLKMSVLHMWMKHHVKYGYSMASSHSVKRETDMQLWYWTGLLKCVGNSTFHQRKLPIKQHCQHIINAHQIIYPRKNHDKWWDLAQLKEQLKDAIDIFEYLHPDAVAIWEFDFSSSHKVLASDVLNVNNMNVHPGEKQTRMCNTIIPLNNPPPKDGMVNIWGHIHPMVFPEDHLDPKLAHQAKGMLAISKEQELMYDWLVQECGSEKKSSGNALSVENLLSRKTQNVVLPWQKWQVKTNVLMITYWKRLPRLLMRMWTSGAACCV